MINDNKDLKLAIIGLGYVGLPLALEFSKKRKVIGFDIKEKRIKELNLIGQILKKPQSCKVLGYLQFAL